MRKSDRLTYTFFFILSGIVMLFILLPLIRLLFFLTPQTASVIKDRSVLMSIWNSITLSFMTAIISLVFGVPLAFLMAKKCFGKLEKLVETIVDIPLAVPHTVVGIALLFILSRRGIVGAFLYNSFDFRVTGTRMAIVMAMLFVSFPYAVDSTREGFKKIEPSLEKAAMILGAPLHSIFRTIYLPLTKSAIMTGFLLTWARAISEFGAVVIIAYYPMTAPVKIYDAFTQYSLSTSGAIAAYLLIICMAIFFTLRFAIGDKK